MYQSCSEIDPIETVAAASPRAAVSTKISRRCPAVPTCAVFKFMSFVASILFCTPFSFQLKLSHFILVNKYGTCHPERGEGPASSVPCGRDAATLRNPQTARHE